jgi:mono/diheme cytochrome c family protein
LPFKQDEDKNSRCEEERRMRAWILLVAVVPLLAQEPFDPEIPRTWDEAALEDWATPLAGLNARPGHFSEDEYYAAPIDNLRTYPVYYPGREPDGYWEMLQNVGPQPLIEPEKLKTKQDWIDAGKRVFEQYDVPAFRSLNPKLIAAVRSVEPFKRAGYEPRADGVIPGTRWIPTAKGVALGRTNCALCHVRKLPDGTLLDGAPANEGPPAFTAPLARWAPSALPLPGDSLPVRMWRAYRVPWVQDDIHDSLKSMPTPEVRRILLNALAPGLFPRWNGSAHYVTKIPDLIGLEDRKYIDHTATHLHRGPGDIMRYAALVTVAESVDFGPHHFMTEEQRKVRWRLPDEGLYALTLYVYSLKPPPNPNPFDGAAAEGKKLFEQEGCVGCHTPPLYTNNKVTLAEGFDPPEEPSKFLDVLPVSVGTDPGLALKTRKGTGYYKVPSLKGVWYRGRYLHDGSVTSLEEMFNPARLNDDFVPSGFKPVGVEHQAVRGHEFGLKLQAEQRGQLIAFLKTL